MATLQKEGLLVGKDQDGNTVLIYPITTMDSVDGLSEALGGLKTASVEAVMSASNWNKTAKTYSFESSYPADQYDIAIEPNYTATAEQIEAYGAAMMAGRIDANIVTAVGDVPEIDIPVIIKVVSK